MYLIFLWIKFYAERQLQTYGNKCRKFKLKHRKGRDKRWNKHSTRRGHRGLKTIDSKKVQKDQIIQ